MAPVERVELAFIVATSSAILNLIRFSQMTDWCLWNCGMQCRVYSLAYYYHRISHLLHLLFQENFPLDFRQYWDSWPLEHH